MSQTAAVGPGIVLQTGQMFRQYQVLSKIGQGGMGVVYKAMDVNLQRLAALKILPPAFAQQNVEARNRFVREARSAAQLIHQNIVTVFEAGDEHGQLYIAMEFIDGPSVSALIKHQGRLDLRIALKIIKDAAAGCEFAHNMELVHRDIKPDNILLHPLGMAKVADFGLAKNLSSEGADLTGAGLIVGTPHYMSPEQCEGQEADKRSDIYSLGVTLYHMVTGRQPYQANSTMAILHKHIYDPVPDPREADPTIPEAVARIAMQAMAKKREERYQTLQEMRDDLDRIDEGSAGDGKRPVLPGAGSGGRTPGAADAEAGQTAVIPYQQMIREREEAERNRLRQRRKRNAWIVGAMGVAAACLLGAAFLSSHYLFPKDQLASSSISRSTTSVSSTTIPRKLQPVQVPASGAQKSQPRSTSIGEPVRAVCPAGDTSSVVILDSQGHVHWWDCQANEKSEDAAGPARTVAFSPENNILLLSRGGKITARRMDDSKELFAAEVTDSELQSVSFNPSGVLISAGTKDGQVHVLNASDGKRLYSLEGHQAAVISAHFCSSQKYLFSASTDGDLRLWVPYQKEVHRQFRSASGAIEQAALGRNVEHTTIALIGDGKVHIISLDADEKPTQHDLELKGDTPSALAFSWRARYLAVGTAEGRLHIYELPGWRSATIQPHRSAVTSMAFSQSGMRESNRLVSGSKDGQVSLCFFAGLFEP